MFTSLRGNASTRFRAVFLTIDVILACAASVLFIDLALARYVVANRDTFSEFAIKAIPDMGSPAALLSIVVPMTILTFVKAEGVRANRVLWIFGTIVTAHGFCSILKFLFGRSRPELFFTKGVYDFDFLKVDYVFHSFPSSHAAICAGIATVAGAVHPERRLIMLTAGFALAFTPVVTGTHYLSDAVLGFGIGSASAWAFQMVLTRFHLPLAENREAA
jgi:membrane-associated phospholipid phosphatase